MADFQSATVYYVRVAASSGFLDLAWFTHTLREALRAYNNTSSV
jgi:hypothetical protein